MLDLKVGDCFTSYADWKQHFDEYCTATGQSFKVYTSKSAKNFNKNQEQKTSGKSNIFTLDEKWGFHTVQYCCVYAKGKNKARELASSKPGLLNRKCKAVVAIKYCRQLDRLVVNRLSLDHDHSSVPDSPEPPTAAEDSGDQDLQVSLNPPVVPLPPLDEPIESSSHSDSDDSLNLEIPEASEGCRALSLHHVNDLKVPLTLGSGDVQSDLEIEGVLEELQKMQEADSDSKSSIIVSRTNEILAVFFQTGQMRRAFSKYPDILLFDVNSTLALKEYSLVSFSGHDEKGLGSPVAFAILTKPIKVVANMLLNVFANANPKSSEIKALLMNREKLKHKNILGYFKNATCLLCHYHVVRSILNKMERMKLNFKIQEKIAKVLMSMFVCNHEKNYTDLLKKLESIHSRFHRYFMRIWDPCKKLWAGYCREGLVPWGNGVNERVEVLAQFLNVVCVRSKTLAELVQNLAYINGDHLNDSSTERMLEEIQDTGIKLQLQEMNLISLCCDYASLLTFIQVKMSRAYRYTVNVAEGTYIVTSPTGQGIIKRSTLECTCLFFLTYGLPCCHCFVCAVALKFPLPDKLIPERWKRNTPFPVDFNKEPSVITEEEERNLRYQEKLDKIKTLVEALAALAAVSSLENFNHMYDVINNLYKVWSRCISDRVVIKVMKNVSDSGDAEEAPRNVLQGPSSSQQINNGLHESPNKNQSLLLIDDDSASEYQRPSGKECMLGGLQEKNSGIDRNDDMIDSTTGVPEDMINSCNISDGHDDPLHSDLHEDIVGSSTSFADGVDAHFNETNPLLNQDISDSLMDPDPSGMVHANAGPLSSFPSLSDSALHQDEELMDTGPVVSDSLVDSSTNPVISSGSIHSLSVQAACSSRTNFLNDPMLPQDNAMDTSDSVCPSVSEEQVCPVTASGSQDFEMEQSNLVSDTKIQDRPSSALLGGIQNAVSSSLVKTESILAESQGAVSSSMIKSESLSEERAVSESAAVSSAGNDATSLLDIKGEKQHTEENSPVLLSIKDPEDETSDSRNTGSQIRLEKIEGYSLLESMMEAGDIMDGVDQERPALTESAASEVDEGLKKESQNELELPSTSDKSEGCSNTASDILASTSHTTSSDVLMSTVVKDSTSEITVEGIVPTESMTDQEFNNEPASEVSGTPMEAETCDAKAFQM